MSGRRSPPRLARRTRRRDKITIHLYALCWNEERMLPYFFRHYDPVVDLYFIADSGSTDGSVRLLRRHRRVVVSRFTRDESFVQSATDHYNQCWKPSRGIADWVFVVNVDEHVHRPRLRGFLRACRRQGVSIVVAEGYNMVSSAFPRSARPLWRTIQYGVRDPIWDKPQIFDPAKVDEINFAPGRHSALPSGDVVFARTGMVKLLHYKYLGADYLVKRHAELRSAMPDQDLARGWGYQYAWGEQKNLDELERHRARAVRVV
jgi:hypothetical protein